jgi:hypothetical protein
MYRPPARSSLPLLLTVALLASPSPARAQDDEGLPLPGPRPRLDLQGGWVGRAGLSVVFSRRDAAPAYDHYRVTISALDAPKRELRARFDGVALDWLIEPKRAAASPPRRTASSVGLRGALAGEALTRPYRPGPDRSSSAPGAVRSRHRLELRSRDVAGKRVEVAIFRPTASGRLQGPGRFERPVLGLGLAGPDSLVRGLAGELEARVSPAIPGGFEWLSSDPDLRLEPRGSSCKAWLRSAVTKPRRARIDCRFTDRRTGSYQGGHKIIELRPRARSVRILSLDLLSDHGLLLDNRRDWTGAGQRFLRPVWTPRQSQPVSHTGGRALRVRLRLEVEPAGAFASGLVLRGESRCGLTLQAPLTLAGGVTTIELGSGAGRFPRGIARRELDISWSLVGENAPPLGDRRTRLPLYLTLGCPSTPLRNPGITMRRLEEAIKCARLATDLSPHALAGSVSRRFGAFNLEVAYRNAWELGDERRDAGKALIGADCQTLVRYTQNVLAMLGCPGKATFAVVWPKVSAPRRGVLNLGTSPNVCSPRQLYSRWSIEGRRHDLDRDGSWTPKELRESLRRAVVTQLGREFDRDQDGSLDARELTARLLPEAARLLSRYDRSSNGSLEAEEWSRACRDPSFARRIEALIAPRFARLTERRLWYACLIDGDGGLNRYEAVLRFSYGGSTRLYPGGVDVVFDHPDEVLEVFDRLSWVGPDRQGLLEQKADIIRY